MADDLFQQLTHIGSALGPIGVALSGFLTRAVNQVTKTIEEAKKSADEAVKVANEAKMLAQSFQGAAQNSPEVRKLSQAFDDVRSGLRMELTTFKTGMEERFSQASQELRAMVQSLMNEVERRVERDVERIVRGSRPDAVESDALLVELRSTLDHERDQRIALQETLTGHMKDGVERWLKMERFIGNIESTVETWRRERSATEEKIEPLRREIDALHRELRDLRLR
jgi:hypothetical protein